MQAATLWVSTNLLVAAAIRERTPMLKHDLISLFTGTIVVVMLVAIRLCAVG